MTTKRLVPHRPCQGAVSARGWAMNSDETNPAAVRTNSTGGDPTTPLPEPGAAPAPDAAHPAQTRVARKATYRQLEPGVYRYIERNRYGREQVRYRTHMGQICKST